MDTVVKYTVREKGDGVHKPPLRPTPLEHVVTIESHMISSDIQNNASLVCFNTTPVFSHLETTNFLIQRRRSGVNCKDTVLSENDNTHAEANENPPPS